MVSGRSRTNHVSAPVVGTGRGGRSVSKIHHPTFLVLAAPSIRQRCHLAASMRRRLCELESSRCSQLSNSAVVATPANVSAAWALQIPIVRLPTGSALVTKLCVSMVALVSNSCWPHQWGQPLVASDRLDGRLMVVEHPTNHLFCRNAVCGCHTVGSPVLSALPVLSGSPAEPTNPLDLLIRRRLSQVHS